MRGNFFHCLRWRTHLVDRCLLLLMAILLLQSVCSLFLPGEVGQLAGSVDVMARTSAAGIFGYLLGVRFARPAEDGGGVSGTPARLPETAVRLESAGPRVDARIGFADSAPAQASDTGVQPPVLTGPEKSAEDSRVQVLVAAGIGAFCLIVLLVLRNLTQLQLLPEPTGPVVETVTQFRDFVSGCVGFLIGSPTVQR